MNTQLLGRKVSRSRVLRQVGLALVGGLVVFVAGLRADDERGLLATVYRQASTPHDRFGGDAWTGLFLLDLDEEREAIIATDLYHRVEGGPRRVLHSHVRPESFVRVYLPTATFPSGFHGVHSVIVESNRALGTVAYTDWAQSKSFAGHEAAHPGQNIVVPFVSQAWLERSTQINVQNTHPQDPAVVELSFHDPLGQLVTTGRLSLSPAMSASFFPGRYALPDGFHGSLRLRAAQPLAASVFLSRDDGGRGVAAFQAAPVEHAAARLFAPEVSAMVELELSNPGDQSIDVEVFYRRNADDSGAPCAIGDVEVAHFAGPVTIPAHGGLSVVPADILPPGCGASAAVRADGPLLGVAFVLDAEAARASAYNLGSLEEAGRDLVLPLYRNRHDSRYRFTTTIDALNLAEVTATMTLDVREDFMPWAGPIVCDACTVRVGPGASYRFDPEMVPGLLEHVDVFGSAVLRSDQPTIAVVEDMSLTGDFDTASYRGVAMCSPVGGPAPEYCDSWDYVPWASRAYLREWAILLPAVFSP